jgi:hypothetical protein
MMSRILIAAGLLVVIAIALPVDAEHNSAPAPERDATLSVAPAPERDATLSVPGTEHTLDLNLKLGLNGFRLGSRLFGRDGYAGGAWLNGETRKDGFSLDGRIEHDGKAHNFKFNADIDEWLRRAIRWWGAMDQ